MILMQAHAPNLNLGAAPSGSNYVSDGLALVKVSNNSVVDQQFLATLGCYTLTPFSGWGSGMIDTLADLYAADAATGLILPGQVGFPRYTVIGVFNDPSNGGTWAKTGTGVGSGNWTRVSTSTNLTISADSTAIVAAAQAVAASAQQSAGVSASSALATAADRTQCDADASAAGASATSAAGSASTAAQAAATATADAAQAHTDRINADASATMAEGLALTFGPARLFQNQAAAAAAVAAASPTYPNNTPILVVNTSGGLDFYYTNGTALVSAGVTLAGNTATGRADFIAKAAADGLFNSVIGAGS